jgi:hypothetical protein
MALGDSNTFAQGVSQHEVWLHYREDRHPTVEGHRIIAEEVAWGLAEGGLLAKVAGKTGHQARSLILRSRG